MNKFLSTYGATASSLNFATENFLAWCGSIDIIIRKEVFGRETEELEEIEEIQTSIKSCSAAAMLRAEQWPCEPSEDFVIKFGEQ